jgi:hypothetical protein
MKRAEEIYKENDWYDYQPMLDEFGEIILQVDEDGYQGDSFLIYKDSERYGYLTFGWGSCGRCDALQACKTSKQVQELMDDLYHSIEWFDTLEELKTCFVIRDWSLRYEYYVDKFKTFLERVKEL